MNLLFISNLYPPVAVGGYEYTCHDLACGMHDRGHQVSVLTGSYRASTAADHDTNATEHIFRWLSLIHGPYFRAGSPGVARERTADRVNVQALRRVLTTTQPDAIFVFGASGIGRSILAVAARQAPIIYVVSDQWLLRVLRGSRDGRGSIGAHLARAVRERSISNASRALLRRAAVPFRALLGSVTPPVAVDSMVFCSEFLRAQYVRQGLDVGSRPVIHPAVKTDVFRPLPLDGKRVTGKPRRLLYVGRIATAKGTTTLIRAMGLLKRDLNFRDAELTLFGTIEEEAYGRRLIKLIQELGISDAVTIQPHRDRSQMPDVYREHDVVVFPSEWDEPFGLVLVEAMASALPVVTTLRGGASEIVGDRRVAIPFKAGDPDDLAAKLAWVLTHPRQAGEIGLTARQEAVKRFDLTEHVSSYGVYLDAIVGKPLKRAGHALPTADNDPLIPDASSDKPQASGATT